VSARNKRNKRNKIGRTKEKKYAKDKNKILIFE
jgi:hypothetical protein